jgi:hypothetical protein
LWSDHDNIGIGPNIDFVLTLQQKISLELNEKLVPHLILS